jgi:hypothetical protein
LLEVLESWKGVGKGSEVGQRIKGASPYIYPPSRMRCHNKLNATREKGLLWRRGCH